MHELRFLHWQTGTLDELKNCPSRATMQCESKIQIPKRLGIFSPNFTGLLLFPIYARLQIFIQLSATLTKLRHIKRNRYHHYIIKMPTIG